jgi:hypothetical protein
MIPALFDVPTFGRCILKADLGTRCGDNRPANMHVRRQVIGRRSGLKAKLPHSIRTEGGEARAGSSERKKCRLLEGTDEPCRKQRRRRSSVINSLPPSFASLIYDLCRDETIQSVFQYSKAPS